MDTIKEFNDGSKVLTTVIFADSFEKVKCHFEYATQM
jgi:hypothetical protein